VGENASARTYFSHRQGQIRKYPVPVFILNTTLQFDEIFIVEKNGEDHWRPCKFILFTIFIFYVKIEIPLLGR
jgi:hypothetical protein